MHGKPDGAKLTLFMKVYNYMNQSRTKRFSFGSGRSVTNRYIDRPRVVERLRTDTRGYAP